MADTHGNSPDSVIDELVKRPHAFDFFRAVRLLECQRPDLPRVGFSISPSEDPLRFWQNPSLRFAPASLDTVTGTLIVELARKLDEILKKRGDSEPALDLCVVVHPTALDQLRAEDGKALVEMEKRCSGRLSFEADSRLRTEEFRIVNVATKENVAVREELAEGSGGSVPRMAVNFFGLFGPNAPLPPHITEYVLERELHHHDPTITAFFNLFHHRLISLFYRAWAANQKVVDLDRPKEQRYAVYIGALFGIGMDALQECDAVPDAAKLFFSGRLACQTRNAEGLEAILREYFHIPVEVQPFTGRWLNLPADSICRLGESAENGSLGANAIVGSRFWDCQLSFRMKFGPMGLADYERMLPKGDSFERLKYWVLNYCGEHFFWDVQLVLRADEVPPTRLGQTGPAVLSMDDLLDLPSLAAKLSVESQPHGLAHYLWNQLSPATKDQLRDCTTSVPLPRRQAIADDFNRIIQSIPLYEPKRFAGVTLSTETRSLLAQPPPTTDLPGLNRRLLEDAFPLEISKHRWPGGLGWTTWLKTKPFALDADQLILNPPPD